MVKKMNKIKYLKKMQEELERESSYFHKISDSNRRFENLLRKSLGEELGHIEKPKKKSIFAGLTWHHLCLLTGVIMMTTTTAVHINYKLGTCISYFNCNLTYFGASFLFIIVGIFLYKYNVKLEKR